MTDLARIADLTNDGPPGGAWESIVRAPHPRLRACVARYEGYVQRQPRVLRQLEIPSTIVPLIINFGPEYVVSGPGNPSGPSSYGSFIAGLVDAYVIVESTGLSSGIQVNFTPAGAHRFLRVPMDDLMNRAVRFEDILGAAGRRLVAQLEDIPDWNTRFDVLDAVMIERIAASPEPTPEVTHAWRRLHETAGRVAIGALADEIGWSRKHLNVRFRQQIGLPPKTMARVLRFNRVIRQLALPEEPRWAQIAYDCGYYDQSHFNRDFREFTGDTPAGFLRRRPDSGGVLED